MWKPIEHPGRLGPLLVLLALCASGSPASGQAPVFLTTWGRSAPLDPGTFTLTGSVAVDDASGHVYVGEAFRVQKFDANGAFLLEWPCDNCGGIAVNEVTGHVYVSRYAADRIEKYDSSGNLLLSWGGFGPGMGTFDMPWGIAVDSATGSVYVNDSGNGYVQQFDANGAFIRQFGGPGSGPGQFVGVPQPSGLAFDPAERAVYATDPIVVKVLKFDEFGSFLLEWGGVKGRAPGELRWPRGVAVDGASRVYVADTDNERIQVFSSSGGLLGEFQGPHDLASGPFHPRSIAVNRTTGEKYVNAAYAFRVDKFGSDDALLLSWGGRQTDRYFLDNPRGIATSPTTGDVYLFDSGNFLLKGFSPGGAFREQWGGSKRLDVSTPGLFGFSFEGAIDVDPDGNVWAGQVGFHYAGDPDSLFVQKFDPAGNHLLSWIRTDKGGIQYSEQLRGLAVDPVSREVWLTDWTFGVLLKYDAAGAKLLEIPGLKPGGVAVSGGVVYVADTLTQQIRRFDVGGAALAPWGGPGSLDGQLSLYQSSGLTTDAAGNLYVADTFNGRIQAFAPDGSFLWKLGTEGNGPGEFLWPTDVALSPSGDILYVMDMLPDRVQAFCLTTPAVCLAEMDHDADGPIDLDDNCPYTSNPSQLDVGGLQSVGSDGTGDACQCGDGSGNGIVDGLDAEQLRDSLAGLGALAAPQLCSVAGDTGCDLLDHAVLARALGGAPPGLAQACAPALRGP